MKQSVILTGGANGIGKAMVMGLLKDGSRVVTMDQDEKGLNQLQKEVEALGIRNHLHVMPVNLIDQDAAIESVTQAIQWLGHVDTLINNIGIGRQEIKEDIFKNPPKFWEVTPQLWHRFFSINTHAAFLMMRTVVPYMLEKKFGRIVNVTTTLESTVRAGGAAYGPSKAALESLTSIAAHDLMGTGITVNALLPGGPTDTNMIPQSAPIVRDTLLKPSIMVPPLLWLLEEKNAHLTALRFDASKWDATISPEEACALSQAPVAWISIAGKMRQPKEN